MEYMESEIEISNNTTVIEHSSGMMKWAPWFAVLWLLYAMNSILAWYSFGVVFRVVAATGVVFATFRMKDRVVTRKRGWIAFLTFLYYFWAAMKFDHFLAYLSVTMTFVPFMCILFWPNRVLKRTYEIFRKVVIFFAIGSAILTALSYVGLTSRIPHFEMGSQSALHENRNDYYNIYLGIFPELNGINFLFIRACGMMEEPGHFSIVLGFVYLIDRYMQRKINPTIIICAIFTFSSTFFLMMLFTEFWNLIVSWKKALLYLMCTIGLCVVVYNVLPRDMQDMVYYLAYERNMEQVVDAYDSSGSLDEALDERASNLGTRVYDQLSFDQKLVGGEWDSSLVLSDYRGFIVRMGYIGFLLVVLIALLSLSGVPLLLKISLFLSLLMIMLHRSWFFYEPFPYFMSFMACALYTYMSSNNNTSVSILEECQEL
jgi:hypothetical protein